MTLTIVLVNQSQRVGAGDVEKIAEALHWQFREAAPRLGLYMPRIAIGEGWLAHHQDAAGMLIVDRPDQDNALGWHDVDQRGVPYSHLFVDPILDELGGSILGDRGNPADSLAACASHESLEIWGNPWCGRWEDKGTSSVAGEECDPVQADAYMAPNRVALSNYILPAWYNPYNQDGPWDRMERLEAPFSRSAGGYWIEMADGRVRQVFSDGRILEGDDIQAHPGRGSRVRRLRTAQPDS